MPTIESIIRKTNGLPIEKPIKYQSWHALKVAEASICIWSIIVNHRNALSDLKIAWDEKGNEEIRNAAIQLVPIALQIWDELNEEQRESLLPYDWNYFTAFLSQISWTAYISLGVNALPDRQRWIEEIVKIGKG